MRAFRIAEISAVDRPAQEGARAVLMKRDARKLAAERERGLRRMRALMDRVPSAAEQELARLRAEAERLETKVYVAATADEAEGGAAGGQGAGRGAARRARAANGVSTPAAGRGRRHQTRDQRTRGREHVTRQTLETLEALIKAVQDPTNALQKRRADAEDLAERAIDAFVEAHSVTKSHAYATCAGGGGGELGEI